MKGTLRVALALILSASGRLTAQTAPAVPKSVGDALEVFKREGYDKGLRALTARWVGTPDEGKQSELVQAFAPIGDGVGHMLGYDLVHSADVGQHLRNLYIVLLMERQPIFAVLVLYQPPGKEWQTMNVSFNTDIHQIFPPEVAAGRKAPIP